MSEFSAKLSVLATAIVIGVLSVCRGQELVTSWPVKCTTIINGHGSNVQVKAEFLADVAEMATNSFVFFAILRDPHTGYVWWRVVENSPHKNTYVPGYFLHWQGQLRETIWAVPGVGLIEAGETDLHVYTMKSSSIEDAEQQLIAGLSGGKKNDLWPLEQHKKVVHLPLRESLGGDFLFNPLTSMLRRFPHILSITYTTKALSVRLESPAARTNRIAAIELDSDFKVLKATRSN